MTAGGGQTYDAGKLSAGGKAIEDQGSDLIEAGSKIQSEVSMGAVGKAWREVADPYVEAIGKYRDAVNNFGKLAQDFGSKMNQAASSYEHGEAVTAADIAREGDTLNE